MYSSSLQLNTLHLGSQPPSYLHSWACLCSDNTPLPHSLIGFPPLGVSLCICSISPSKLRAVEVWALFPSESMALEHWILKYTGVREWIILDLLLGSSGSIFVCRQKIKITRPEKLSCPVPSFYSWRSQSPERSTSCPWDQAFACCFFLCFLLLFF